MPLQKKSNSQEDITQSGSGGSQEKGLQGRKKTLKVHKEDEAGSIKWTGQLAKLLAYKIRDEYRTKWLCGTRISVAKQWAKEPGLEQLDPKGFKTKAQVSIPIKISTMVVGTPH